MEIIQLRSSVIIFLRHNGVDTSITLDAAKWNCDDVELSPCVITLFYWIMYYNILNTFGTNLPVLTFILLFNVLIYLFMFLIYCDLHASFSFSTYI